jgi:hypothetical protein
VPTYLVERYWPGVTSELLLEALNRGQSVMEQMRTEGTPVRALTSILIPAEEVVFSIYEGPSAAAVRQANDRAGIPVSRIVEAVTITASRLHNQTLMRTPTRPAAYGRCLLSEKYHSERIDGLVAGCLGIEEIRRPVRRGDELDVGELEGR